MATPPPEPTVEAAAADAAVDPDPEPAASVEDAVPYPPPSSPAAHRGNLSTLDMLRGAAALYVAAYHSVDVLTPSGRRFHDTGGSLDMILHGNLLGLFGFGFYAVLAFFVLSGFVIHLRQAQRPEEQGRMGAVHWTANYGWRRGMRIYPPLVGAIALTGVLAVLGFRLFPDLYGHTFAHPQAGNLVRSHGTLREVVDVLVPVHEPRGYGANGVLWSIAFELWFYVAYVGMVLLVLGPLRRWMRVRMGVVLAASLALAGALLLAQHSAPQLIPDRLRPLVVIAEYFPAWVAGAFVAELYATGVRLRRRRWAVAAAGVLVVVAAAHSDNDFRPAVDVAWCLALCLLVAALTLGPERDWLSDRAGRAAAGTAAWSYSLYLVHLPVILFVYGALGDGTRPVTNPLVVVAAFLAAVGVGWLFYQAVERPSTWLVARPPAAIARSRTR